MKLILTNNEIKLKEKRMELIENEGVNFKKNEDKENYDSKSDFSFENEKPPFIIEDN